MTPPAKERFAYLRGSRGMEVAEDGGFELESGDLRSAQEIAKDHPDQLF